jgi:hypothetical protein
LRVGQGFPGRLGASSGRNPECRFWLDRALPEACRKSVADRQVARFLPAAEAQTAGRDLAAAKSATGGGYPHHILPETGLQRIRATAGL